MTDEKVTHSLDAVDSAIDDVAAGASKKKKKPRKPFSKRAKIICTVIAVVIVAGGIGMWKWHEMPSFCATLCHVEETYVNNLSQEQGVAGVDKYGNAVSNSNAMMAVLHSKTQTTAKPEIVCVDCHIPNMLELAHDGVNYVTGNYTVPRSERTASQLEEWDKKEGSQFCANENCHVYLLGNDGLVSPEKLAAVTADMEFNPHEQHHANLNPDCTACHKGHRASTIVCTACHQHQDVEVPDGWVDWDTSQQIMVTAFNG
ncbi:MAG: salivary glue protein Sgs-3 [Eggerthellaceae bacterium]|nr:salivary glue protein Sgs-3 [Eggerthellaceae bacterium]